MSTKEEKPTLAGVNVKTRKRNIVIPLDPGSFADAIIQICQEAFTGESVESDLEAAAKALDSTQQDLEWSRYSDTLFEVFFAGGRLATGTSLADDCKKKLEHNIFNTKSERNAIEPFIKVFQQLTRRRPFLIRGLENTVIKLLLSIEFHNEEGRKKIAIAMALIFALKIAVVPENIFGNMFNDRLVTKGLCLEVLTTFMQEFLAITKESIKEKDKEKEALDDLVGVLVKAKVANRLLDFLPPGKRTSEELAAHFTAAGLKGLVDWNTQREVEAKINELQTALGEMITADPPAPQAEVLAMMKAKKTEHNLPDNEVVRVAWVGLMRSINMTGKNQQQIMQSVVQKIKSYHKILSAFCTNGKMELALLVTVQVYCYEDNRLLKLFSDILRKLYDAEIIGEDTILHWYKKGSHPKGRGVFLNDIQPFIKWLEEAEEDSDEEA